MSDTNPGTIELISFDVGEQTFCLDIGAVREIRGWTKATPIPHAPDYMRGVINLRGAVMPIVDLRARLGLGTTEVSERHVIVVVQSRQATAGLLVDAVQETFIVNSADLQPPPRVQGDAFVDAIFPLEGRLLSRLAIETLLPQELATA